MSSHAALVLVENTDGITTLTMNAPEKLNGWTLPMVDAISTALSNAAADPDTQVVIFTGTGRYYSAGVKLASLKLMAPSKLHGEIERRNKAVFDMFIEFPKPILVAVNGPAIGAVVTSATLCDDTIAVDSATFSTPFAALGVAREGCSTVHLPRLIGTEAAERMLGDEGWKPTAAEALEIGMISEVVAPEALMETARARARAWIAEGRTRGYRAGSTREELLEVNARESKALADSFMSAPFLRGQFRFLKSKGKWGPAAVFLAAWLTVPLWGRRR